MANFERKRVVVTGMEAITPIGNTLSDYWDGLKAGRNGIGRISAFDPARHASQIAGEVKDFDPTDFLDKKEVRRMDRFAQFAVIASQRALQDANLEINDLNAEQIGVCIGTGIGGLKVMEDQQEVYLTRGPAAVAHLWFR
jgi:3-oxoacyl-[acyl-carrier-protein] synthase II